MATSARPLIPFIDLKAQYLTIQEEIDHVLKKTILSGQFILGSELDHFEQEFASSTGVEHCIGVASGTAALHMALSALNIGPGDEVITSPLTYIATTAAINYVGAQVRFADVDPLTLNLDPRRVAEAIGSHTKAILPVHLYGQPADLPTLNALAKRHHLYLIEDCAQAHLARIESKPVGTWGDVGCYSFHPAKNLGAYGDGGAIVSNSSDYMSLCRILRHQGRDLAGNRYEHLMEGFNYRLDNLQAAILRVKLRCLPHWTARRQELAARYINNLSSLPIQLPYPAPRRTHVYHLFVVRTPARDELAQWLSERGVQTVLHYAIPLHLQPAYRNLGLPAGSFPHAEQAAREVLSLPLYPEMTEEMVDYVCEQMQNFFSH